MIEDHHLSIEKGDKVLLGIKVHPVFQAISTEFGVQLLLLKEVISLYFLVVPLLVELNHL